MTDIFMIAILGICFLSVKVFADFCEKQVEAKEK